MTVGDELSIENTYYELKVSNSACCAGCEFVGNEFRCIGMMLLSDECTDSETGEKLIVIKKTITA